jgi:hypothetical protein
MDIVPIITFVTGLAFFEVIIALTYRARELSRGDVVHHARAYASIRAYAGYAEDGIDRVSTWITKSGSTLWQSVIVPFARSVKKEAIRVAKGFAPTAYLIRVYKAIRGLHTGHHKGGDEEASSFLQEVNAHKSASEADGPSADTQESSPRTENIKTPM